ncbi:MAG: hypothetical protein PVSMB1_10280 [Gemmatimonadaceae bacterium]
MNKRHFAQIGNAALLVSALPACVTRTHIAARNLALTLSPTCSDAIKVYPGGDRVPYDYYEVALITAEANSVYTGNGKVLKAIRSQAAIVGANAVVIDALGTTHAAVKVIGAALGAKDAERKARATAIWMPSDTTRVREACGGN